MKNGQGVLEDQRGEGGYKGDGQVSRGHGVDMEAKVRVSRVGVP